MPAPSVAAMSTHEVKEYRVALCIDARHSCLPGHFPGRPLVPGVMLLEAVADAVRAWRGQRLVRVAEAKFVSPLLPGQQAQILLKESGARLRFEVLHEGALLARGSVEAAA